MATDTSGTSRARTGRRGAVTLTEARVRTICAKVAKGVPQQAAAGSVGIPRRTLQRWLAAGRLPDAVEPYKSFAERLERALDQYHASRVELVHEGAKKDPRMAQWELERRFSSDWSEPRQGGVTVNVGVIVESPEWLALRDRLLEVLAPYPDALAAVAAELAGGGQAEVIEGEAVEVPELEP